jgi:hypothetical protein
MNPLRLLGAAAMALFLVNAVNGQTPTGRYNVRVYHDNDINLLASQNPMVQDDGKVVILSINLDPSGTDPLDEGEVLLVMCEVLVKHENGEGLLPALFSSGLYLGTQATYSATNINTYEITEGNGQNLDTDSGLIFDSHTKIGTFIRPEVFEQDRKFVNFYGKVGANIGEVLVKPGGCKLTAVRFTPILTNQGWKHGWWAPPPFSDDEPPEPGNTYTVTASLETAADVIYVCNLNPSGSDPLKAGDILIAFAEAEADYTGGSPTIQFETQLRLSPSGLRTPSHPDTDKPIGQCNNFSMKDDAREHRAAVKASAYQVQSGDVTNGLRWVKLVAWVPQDTDDVTVSKGKLSVIRLRHAQDDDKPLKLQRYDMQEYNAFHGNPLLDPMELLCDLEASGSSGAQVLFTQKLPNLTNGEILLALSEMEATNQDLNTVKVFNSRLMLSTQPNSNIAVSNITPANAVDIDDNDSMHHGFSTKAGMKVVSGLTTGDYHVNRTVWSNYDFDLNCAPGSCGGDPCDISCSECDQINQEYGRLAVLRFTPLAALCTGDVAPAGSPNGNVDVDDILVVMNGWGLCGTSLCWADVNDDGEVDVDDLLEVIAQWGMCGVPNSEGAPRTVTECYDRSRDLYPDTSSQSFADAYEACIESLCRQGLLENCD